MAYFYGLDCIPSSIRICSPVGVLGKFFGLALSWLNSVLPININFYLVTLLCLAGRKNNRSHWCSRWIDVSREMARFRRGWSGFCPTSQCQVPSGCHPVLRRAAGLAHVISGWRWVNVSELRSKFWKSSNPGKKHFLERNLFTLFDLTWFSSVWFSYFFVY